MVLELWNLPKLCLLFKLKCKEQTRYISELLTSNLKLEGAWRGAGHLGSRMYERNRRENKRCTKHMHCFQVASLNLFPPLLACSMRHNTKNVKMCAR